MAEPLSPKPASEGTGITEVLPKAGLVYSEKGTLSEVLCKPKILPIKSVVLERLEQMERDAAEAIAVASAAGTLNPIPAGRPGSSFSALAAGGAGRG